MFDLSAVATTSVGLITSGGSDAYNVMAAEWTYLVAREPLHIAVAVTSSAASQSNIIESRQFGVTLCDASQAALAAFAGSFSISEVDKASSQSFEFVESSAIAPPCVDGGLLRAECNVVKVVNLPGYALIIGEAVHWTADETKLDRPLVKHGGFFNLGSVIERTEVVLGARFADDSLILAVTAPHLKDKFWSVEAFDASQDVVFSHSFSLSEDSVDLIVLPCDAVGVHSVKVTHSSGRTALASIVRQKIRAGAPRPQIGSVE